jgi:hypothetical protein
MQGRRVGLIVAGQNIDRVAMLDVLAGRVPGRSKSMVSQLAA